MKNVLFLTTLLFFILSCKELNNNQDNSKINSSPKASITPSPLPSYDVSKLEETPNIGSRLPSSTSFFVSL